MQLEVPFGVEVVHYAVGVASCGVPGVPAGLGALWEHAGRLPWPRLVEPALRLARTGVLMPPAHAACLEMLAPVMTMHEGGRIYAPEGRLLRPWERLHQPGLAAALETLAREGAATVYRGTLADALIALMEERDGAVTRTDLEAYRPLVSNPPGVATTRSGLLFMSRRGLNAPLDVLARAPTERVSPGKRALWLVRALVGDDSPGHTTNVTVVDRDENACVVTTSLGLGSGDWLPGYDLHLNSMLGEADLLTGELAPGERLASMMAPTVALDERGGLGVRPQARAAAGAEGSGLVVGVAPGVGTVGDGRQALEVGRRQCDRDAALAADAAQGGPGGRPQRGVRVGRAARRAVAQPGDDHRGCLDARHGDDAHHLVGLAGGLDVGEHRLQVHHGLAWQVVPGREVGAVGGVHRADDEGVDGELGGWSGREGHRGHAGRLSTAGRPGCKR